MFMSYWLLKTEPGEYGYDDLERSDIDRWDGVRNFTALSYIRKMKPGDRAFIYHTGKIKSIVGTAEILSEPYPDPRENDPRFVVVDLKAQYRLQNPISLAVIKQRPEFAGWELVRVPRLSVMPVKEEHWKLIHELAKTK